MNPRTGGEFIFYPILFTIIWANGTTTNSITRASRHVHFGEADRVWQQRQREAYDRDPEQFINGIPQILKPPQIKCGSINRKLTQIWIWNNLITQAVNDNIVAENDLTLI